MFQQQTASIIIHFDTLSISVCKNQAKWMEEIRNMQVKKPTDRTMKYHPMILSLFEKTII